MCIIDFTYVELLLQNNVKWVYCRHTLLRSRLVWAVRSVFLFVLLNNSNTVVLPDCWMLFILLVTSPVNSVFSPGGPRRGVCLIFSFKHRTASFPLQSLWHFILLLPAMLLLIAVLFLSALVFFLFLIDLLPPSLTINAQYQCMFVSVW